MTNPQSNASEATNGLWKRIKDIVLNKVIELVVMAIFASLAGFFGWQHWFGGPNEKVGSMENTAIEEGNIGFKRTSAWLGLSSRFETFTDGKDKAPFSVLKTGNHTITFNAKAKTSDGGIMGVGSTKTFWGIAGSFSGDFKSNSLKALLDDGEENFLVQTILPIIRDSADENLPQVVADAEVTEEGLQKLQQLVYEQVSGKLLDEYDVGNVLLQINSVRKLVKADLKGDHIEALDSATSETMVREVKVAKSLLGRLSRILSIGFAGAFLLVLGLFVVVNIFN